MSENNEPHIGSEPIDEALADRVRGHFLDEDITPSDDFLTRGFDAIRRLFSPSAATENVTALSTRRGPSLETLRANLAAAAAGPSEPESTEFGPSSEHRLSTRWTRLPNGRLQLQISAAESNFDHLVGVTWQPGGSVGSGVRIVTPLAGGSEVASVRYDVDLPKGLESADVDVSGAEVIKPESVEPHEIDAAFAQRLVGRSVRAWRTYLEHSRVSPTIEARIREHLTRFNE